MEAETMQPIANMQSQSTSASPSVINGGHNPSQDSSDPVSPATSTRSLKRSADMLNNDDERQDNKRKRLSDDEKENESAGASSSTAHGSASAAMDGTDASKLVEEMGLELSCGCCTEMCYNPVIVLPCQHYYCGSCYTLWTQNRGVNCPSCRSPVTSIVPSRAIQSLIEVYLRSVPSKARTAREKEQADEVYTAGRNIRVPTPRPRSPEIAPPQDNDAYHRPCPHCAPNNDFNWSCPEPIIDPAVDINRAKLLSDGVPTGHARCGSCEHIHATRAPSTSRCDFCSQSYCGLVVPNRCHAKKIRDQRPINMENLMDILGNSEVYDAFAINAVEFDYMLDYLRERDLNPRSIYAEIVEPLVASNDGWKPLLDLGMFPEVNARMAESAAQDPPPANTQQTTDGHTPESPAQTPETAVDVPAPAELQPPGSDQDMPLGEGTGDSNAVETNPSEPQPENAVPLSDNPHISSSETLTTANQDVVMETATTDAPSDIRPPTPLAVPDREQTPSSSIPEPTLDALPMDVEQVTESAAEPVAAPVAEPSAEPAIEPASETTAEAATTTEQGLLIVASEDDNSSHSSEGSNSGDNEEQNTSSPSSPVTTGNASTSRLQLHKICRACAAEIFFWGARNWWIKERAKAVASGELAEEVRNRKDCENLGNCDQEFDNSHAREFNHIPKPPASENTPQENATTASTDQPEEPSQTASTSDAQNTATAASQTNDGASSTANAALEEPEQPSPSVPPENNNMNVDPPIPASVTVVPAPETAPVSAPENGDEHIAVTDPANNLMPTDTIRQPDSTAVGQQPSESSQTSEELDVQSPESSQGSFVAPLVDIINPALNIASEPQTQAHSNGLGQSQKDEPMHMSPNGDVHMAEAEQNSLPISSATVSSATTQVV